MFYKPNFCAECGEKIDNLNRSFLASSKFCDDCVETQKTVRFLPPIFAGITALGIFWLGVQISPTATESKTLNVSTTQSATVASVSQTEVKQPIIKTEKTQNFVGKVESESKNLQKPPIKVNEKATISEPIKQVAKAESEIKKEVQPIETEEPNYFCGAATKKGSPCSRKVKGFNRCWQHQGKEALLPKEKLLIK